MKQTQYREAFGKILWPDGFSAELEGKSIEEQMRCYALSDDLKGPMTYHMFRRTSFDPIPEGMFDGVILKDGLVAGFTRGDNTYLPNRIVSEDDYSDNNGAGYKERTSYTYLVCVSDDPNRTFDRMPPFGAPEHVIDVPVTECAEEVALPEKFVECMRGKSIAQQMDYFRILDTHSRSLVPDPTATYYGFYWCNGKYGAPLRYDARVLEIFVKDGLIVGVRMDYSFPKYGVDRKLNVYADRETEVFEMRKDDDSDIVFSGYFTLEPILYTK